MFIGILVKHLDLEGIGSLQEEQIENLLKSSNSHDLNKINQN